MYISQYTNFELAVSNTVTGAIPTGSVSISGENVNLPVEWFVAATTNDVKSLSIEGATEITITPTGIKINGIERNAPTALALTENATIKYEATGTSKDVFADVAIVIKANDVTVKIDDTFKDASTTNPIKIDAEEGATGVNVEAPDNKYVKVDDEKITVETPKNTGGGGEKSNGWVVPVVVVIVVVVVAGAAVGGFFFWRSRKEADNDAAVA